MVDFLISTCGFFFSLVVVEGWRIEVLSSCSGRTVARVCHVLAVTLSHGLHVSLKLMCNRNTDLEQICIFKKSVLHWKQCTWKISTLRYFHLGNISFVLIHIARIYYSTVYQSIIIIFIYRPFHPDLKPSTVIRTSERVVSPDCCSQHELSPLAVYWYECVGVSVMKESMNERRVHRSPLHSWVDFIIP